jgi:hypothetical protein
MRERFSVVAGQTAPVIVSLVEIDSDSGTDRFPVDQANSYEGRAQPVEGGATVTLPASLESASEQTLALDASALPEGEHAVQIRLQDSAGRLHIAPSDGDGFRLQVKPAY